MNIQDEHILRSAAVSANDMLMRYFEQRQPTTADDIEQAQLSAGWTMCTWRPKNKHLFTVILSCDIQYCRLDVFTFGLCMLHAFL